MKRIIRLTVCTCILLMILLHSTALADNIELPPSSTAYSNEFAQYALTLAGLYTQSETASSLSANGFNVLAQNNYNKLYDDTSHTCAYTIGAQDIELNGKYRTLLLCTIRGTTAGEWYSNFDFAPSHNDNTLFAENFMFAANDIFLQFIDIIDSYENPLILVVGHSRGAACANLLGVLLNARYDYKNIYIYTFATPMTVRKSLPNCDNIFNIINSSDIITKLPLASWGYMRAGHDIVLDSDAELTQKETNALEKLNKLAPDITSYYTLRHSFTEAGESEDGMTTFEMMLLIAQSLIKGTNSVDTEIAQSGALSEDSDFSELIDMLNLLDGSWTDNEVLKQHMPQTYMNLLKEYTEEE